jgi:glutamine synthetase type III
MGATVSPAQGESSGAGDIAALRLKMKTEETIMSTVPEMFASKVFDDRVMKSKLSSKVYNSLKNTIDLELT